MYHAIDELIIVIAVDDGGAGGGYILRVNGFDVPKK